MKNGTAIAGALVAGLCVGTAIGYVCSRHGPSQTATPVILGEREDHGEWADGGWPGWRPNCLLESVARFGTGMDLQLTVTKRSQTGRGNYLLKISRNDGQGVFEWRAHDDESFLFWGSRLLLYRIEYSTSMLGRGNGHVIAVDMDNGTEVWRTPFPEDERVFAVSRSRFQSRARLEEAPSEKHAILTLFEIDVTTYRVDYKTGALERLGAVEPPMGLR